MKWIIVVLTILAVVMAGCVVPEHIEEANDTVIETPTPTETATAVITTTVTPTATVTPTKNVTRGWQTGGGGSGGSSRRRSSVVLPSDYVRIEIDPDNQTVLIGENCTYTVSVQTNVVNQTHFLMFDMHNGTIGGQIVGYCDGISRTGCVGWTPMNESVYNFTLMVVPMNGSELDKIYTFLVSDNDMNVTASAQMTGAILLVPEIVTFVLVVLGLLGIVLMRKRE